MEVKKVDVRTVNMNSSLKGFAIITLTDNEDTLVVDGFKIMSKKDGSAVFVSFPSTSYTNKDGQKEYKDTVFPTNAELRDKISAAILRAYNSKAGRSTQEVESPQAAATKPAYADDDFPF